MWKIGSVQVTPIFETDASAVIQGVIPQATKESMANDPWLRPHYVDDEGKLLAASQSFLVQADGKNILVDTGVGNNKTIDETIFPGWSGLKTDFLQRLGVPPEAIDTVLCTHFHLDHIGWNTQLVDGEWIPTFPRARYVLIGSEFAYWQADPGGELDDDKHGVTEAILPLLNMGVVDMVEPGYQVTEEISLLPTQGHTGGHCSVFIKSEGQSAVITGDVYHHPVQIAHPEWMHLEAQSLKALMTRRAFTDLCASTNTVVIGTHFAAPAAGYIKRRGTEYYFSPLES